MSYIWRVLKADKRVEFATLACGRCGGSGRFGPVVVANGVCFDCGGRGWKLSRPAARAFDALQEARTARTWQEIEASPEAWDYTGGRPTAGGGYAVQTARVVSVTFDASERRGGVGVADDLVDDGYDKTYTSADGKRWLPTYPFRVVYGRRDDDAVSLMLTLKEYRTSSSSFLRDFRRTATEAELIAVLGAHSPKSAVRRVTPPEPDLTPQCPICRRRVPALFPWGKALVCAECSQKPVPEPTGLYDVGEGPDHA